MKIILFAYIAFESFYFFFAFWLSWLPPTTSASLRGVGCGYCLCNSDLSRSWHWCGSKQYIIKDLIFHASNGIGTQYFLQATHADTNWPDEVFNSQPLLLHEPQNHLRPRQDRSPSTATGSKLNFLFVPKGVLFLILSGSLALPSTSSPSYSALQ